jgi:hypothetical protein
LKYEGSEREITIETETRAETESARASGREIERLLRTRLAGGRAGEREFCVCARVP